jgi:hypothetical protein
LPILHIPPNLLGCHFIERGGSHGILLTTKDRKKGSGLELKIEQVRPNAPTSLNGLFCRLVVCLFSTVCCFPLILQHDKPWPKARQYNGSAHEFWCDEINSHVNDQGARSTTVTTLEREVELLKQQVVKLRASES